MTRLFIGTALAIVASAALAAQTPSTPAAAAAQTAPKPVTYTGCLKAGASAGTYVLADAAKDRKTTTKKGTLTPAAAAATTGDATATEKTFAIAPASAGLDLGPQVGHEVDAVGTLSKQAKKQPQLFTVTAVTMRTDHCW